MIVVGAFPCLDFDEPMLYRSMQLSCRDAYVSSTVDQRRLVFHYSRSNLVLEWLLVGSVQFTQIQS